MKLKTLCKLLLLGVLTAVFSGCTIHPTEPDEVSVPTIIPPTANTPPATTPTEPPPPTNNTTTPPTSADYYIVQPGDTIFNVMRQTGVYWKKIVALNPLKAPKYTIYPGQKLRIR